MSSLRQNSNMLNDQKIEPNKQYGEVGHVTDSIDHRCVQAYGTSRKRLRNHHRSVRCNLISHGLSGSGGVAK